MRVAPFKGSSLVGKEPTTNPARHSTACVPTLGASILIALLHRLRNYCQDRTPTLLPRHLPLRLCRSLSLGLCLALRFLGFLSLGGLACLCFLAITPRRCDGCRGPLHPHCSGRLLQSPIVFVCLRVPTQSSKLLSNRWRRETYSHPTALQQSPCVGAQPNFHPVP